MRLVKHRAAISVVVLIAFLLVRAITSPRSNGDTDVLIRDTQRILDCAQSGVFHGCTIVHFPLFQFIPALILKARGTSDATVAVILAWLNWAAFAATVALMWWALRRSVSRTVAMVAVFVLLTGPLLPYSVETFNEPAAAFLVLAFSVAVLVGAHPGWIVLLCVLAAITKETAPPFLFLLGLCGLFGRQDARHSKAMNLAVLVVACGVGAAINSGFNYFRYYTIFNVQLLAREFRVDTREQQAVNFAGIWLSPNGGVIPFWPSFALVCGVVGHTVLTARPRVLTVWWPATLLAALLLGLTIGLSAWYVPLGWIAWGPRLLLPWLPAVVFLASHFYSAAIERGVAWLSANPARFWTATVFFTACALPHFVEVLDSRVLSAMFAPDALFPRMMTVQEDRAGYFAQANHFMWSKGSMLVDSYEWVWHPRFRDKLLLCVACVVVLAQAIAASARESLPPSRSIPDRDA